MEPRDADALMDGGGVVERLDAQAVIRGRGEGPAVVSTETISFWGDVDPSTGTIVNPRHPLRGERLAGRVLVYRQGRGSCTTSNILLELIRTRQAPVAIVSRSVEPVLAVGPLVGEAMYGRTIPMVTVDESVFGRLQTGDWLVVDAEAGVLWRGRRPGGPEPAGGSGPTGGSAARRDTRAPS